MIPESYKKDFDFKLSNRDIISKLIKYISEGIANKAKTSVMINVLKVLNYILVSGKEQGKLEEYQNMLDSINATKMFLNLIADSETNHI